jgi:RNA-splicing ligase RtcB
MHITVHSGSRMLGGKIFKYFTKDAGKVVFNKDLFNLKLADIKREYTGKEIAVKVAELKKECTYTKPIYAEDINEYIEYMQLANTYATLNRKLIAEYIAKNVLQAEITDCIESIHNYYDTSDNILRKGAISAKLDEKIVIPLNMAEGIVIARGLGNKDYNYSCAHGLGRNFSRSQAKKEITLAEFKESMQHVYSTSVVESTIDESPMAYKSYEEVFAHLKDTIEVIEILKPILNVKEV